MRTRTALLLQGDVLNLLDEVGSAKPSGALVLETLNQAWCDEYGKLVQAGIQWNLQTSTFQTVSGQDLYGLADGAMGGGITSVSVQNVGTGYTSVPSVLISGGGGTGGGQLLAVLTGTQVTSITVVRPGFYTTSPTLTITSGGGSGAAANAAISSTYWQTAGVDVQIDAGRFRPAHRFQFEQRNSYDLSTFSWPEPVLYDVWGGTSDASGYDGTRLKFVAPPAGAYTCRHLWHPAPQRLVNDGDVFDGVAGAERVIVYRAAAELAWMLEQFELGDRWSAAADKKAQSMLNLLRDRNVGEAPMARLVRGRPTIARRWRGGWAR